MAAKTLVGNRKTTTTSYERNPYISEYIKRKAKGICELCENPAPFEVNGQQYLECHHIEWVSKGGSDSIENTVALCPNCLRKMHQLNLESDKIKLMNKK